jgi:hypothetical protein
VKFLSLSSVWSLSLHVGVSLPTNLTPWRRVFSEKLIVAYLVKKSLAFYGTRKFIALFTAPPLLDPILSQINPIPVSPLRFLLNPF